MMKIKRIKTWKIKLIIKDNLNSIESIIPKATQGSNIFEKDYLSIDDEGIGVMNWKKKLEKRLKVT